MRRNLRWMRSFSILCLTFSLVFSNVAALAQGGQGGQGGPGGGQPAPPPKPPINQSNDPLLKNFVWRSIGPAGMGGRIDDIEAVENNPFIYYVGYATGGLWKTVNNGTTFEPLFDTYPTASVGDIAICQSNPDIVWVGSGEANNRQSSSFGDGIYKSTDGGKTFTNMGLKETQSIARVVIDPKDPNTVYVAALGHLFGPNKERGVYKTSDGGKTWANVKFIDENTGFTDLVIDPADTKTLYAASYQRRRTSWGYNGGGPGSALWKTTDAGKTWTKIQGNGWPEGLLGRIGMDVARSNPNILYAQVEVGASAGSGVSEETPGGQPGQQGGPGGGGFGGGGGGGQNNPNTPPDPKKSGLWRSDDKGKTWRIVSSNNNRPMYYSQVRVDPSNPETVFTGGLNFSRSTDGGKTFKNLAGVAHSDHHAIWINPKNGQHVMVGNDGGLDVSYDQGETFDFINTMAMAQFYAVSADMRKPYFVCGGLQDNGSWCGPSAVRTGGGGFGGGGQGGAGITNAEWFRVGGGDGFYTQQDPTDHNIVYSESQNGAVQRLDLKTGRSTSIRPRAAQRPRGGPGGGGPGGQAPAAAGQQAPPAQGQPGQESQPNQQEQLAQMAQAFGFGNIAQSNIVPAPPVGEQYRFNWSTPILLSPHNPRIVYVGGNRFFKSLDRGETWTASADLTKQVDRSKLSIMDVPGNQPMASKHDGVTAFSTITVVAESPVLPGVLWIGTDDGNVQLSKDGGATWTNISNNIPILANTNHQVSRVEPSHFDAGTCYVTVDAHRANDHKPYIYITKDFGATWTSVVGNLPMGNVYVVREDLKNKNLLFTGTEYGLFVSLNGGGEWKKFMTGLPTVRVDDLLIHPRDNDLIAGTHGRGIWICDDISALQQLNEKVLASNAHLFDIRPGVQWLNDVTFSRAGGGQKVFRGENPLPGTAISYLLSAAPSGDVKITVSDINGKVVRNITGTKDIGMNRLQWNLRGDPPPRPAGARGPGGGGGGGGRGGFNAGLPLEPGAYLVKLAVDGKEITTKVVIEADTWK